MKKIILYGRRNTCFFALSYLVACGYEIKIITDDDNVKWLAGKLGVKETTLEIMGDYDLLLSVHANKIIPDEILQHDKMVNLHPCIKYRGQNPIKRYIANGDTEATIDSHYMTSVVDGGEIIHSEKFTTGKVETYADFYNIAIPFYYRAISRTLEILNQ